MVYFWIINPSEMFDHLYRVSTYTQSYIHFMSRLQISSAVVPSWLKIDTQLLYVPHHILKYTQQWWILFFLPLYFLKLDVLREREIRRISIANWVNFITAKQPGIAMEFYKRYRILEFHFDKHAIYQLKHQNLLK